MRERGLKTPGDAASVPSVKRRAFVFAVLALVLAVALIVSLMLGRYDLSLSGVLAAFSNGADPTSLNVLVHLRLPRVFAAACVGAMLACAGCAYQGLFRNPMVSPDLLGASAGAGFGAALGILLSAGGAGVQLTAFVFGIVAVMSSYLLSQRVSQGAGQVLVLLLCGIVVQQLFTAFTSAVKFVADPNSQLPEITFWLMGGLSNVHEDDLPWLLVPFVVGGGALMALRWRINVMALGDEEALSLGVNVRRTRLAVIAAATLITSSAVSVAGMVGWVGLIVPHLARFLVGSDHRALLPASLLLGASFLLVVDDVCRSIYTTEIPLSILTAIIGAPLFVCLIARQGRRR